MRKFGGVSIPRLNSTIGFAPETLPVPQEVRLPMSMHSGIPANPVVNVGDTVKVGQVIGEAAGDVSSPVHASVSGTIKSIEHIDGLTGEKAVTVTIASDGNQTLWEGIAPPTVTNLAEFLEAVKNSGVVGLGGAGYPTAHKLTLAGRGKLDYILVNCLESQPYITSYTRTMLDDAEYVWEGVKLLKQYLAPKHVFICIENNKPEAIKIMQGFCAGTDGVELRTLAPRYPQGQNVLAYNVAGRIVPEGGEFSDVGCVVINCATVAVIAKYIKKGTPLVSKCVTVAGPAVKQPKNVIAPVGTPVRELFDYCGGLKDDVKKIVLGGPITGLAVPNTDVPIGKYTSAALAFSGKSAETPAASACIKCGRCVKTCPMRLIPPNIEYAFDLKRPELLRKFKANMCVECSCCGYVCPSKRPLAQVMTLAKNILRKEEAK
ncbi:MAG: RnfABCDGE type electron transport complex subunit C [Treponema sp.]|nr:RnfABCDGE type electron transport complex subunit C [Treponema sp.]